jgi:3-hydroxyacyl-[acyl-carrier-protein] dehydratase
MMNNLRTAIQSSALGPVQETEPGTFFQSYCFQPEFIGFSGHFPGYPILPAFIEVFIVMIMAEEVEGRPLRIQTLERAKFQKEVLPGQVIKIKYREKSIKGKKKIEAALTVAENQAASFHITFEESAE